jgi:hypothetical protein
MLQSVPCEAWLHGGGLLVFFGLGLAWPIAKKHARSLFISRAEIDCAATYFLRTFPGNAEYIAQLSQESEYFRAVLYDPGRWRRIRKALRRMVQEQKTMVAAPTHCVPPQDSKE